MMKELLTHITHHLDEGISLERLAQWSGYSPFHLHRQLRQELREPVGSFIKRQRMEKAAYLLTLTKIPVSQIKYLVGYNDDSAFSRAFRSIMHCTPTQFRTDNIFKESLQAQQGYLSLSARPVCLPEQRAIVFPSLGDYFSRDIYKVWQDAREYLKAAGASEEDFEYYAILHGCQNINPGPNRYDAVLVPKPGVRLPSSRFFESHLPGGRFACYTFCCPVAGLKEMALLISKDFFAQPQWQHNEGISYFKFQNMPDSESPDNQLITWHLPVC